MSVLIIVALYSLPVLVPITLVLFRDRVLSKGTNRYIQVPGDK